MASGVLHPGTGSGNSKTAGTNYKTTVSGKRDGGSRRDRHRVGACIYRKNVFLRCLNLEIKVEIMW